MDFGASPHSIRVNTSQPIARPHQSSSLSVDDVWENSCRQKHLLSGLYNYCIPVDDIETHTVRSVCILLCVCVYTVYTHCYLEIYIHWYRICLVIHCIFVWKLHFDINHMPHSYSKSSGNFCVMNSFACFWRLAQLSSETAMQTSTLMRWRSICLNKLWV